MKITIIDPNNQWQNDIIDIITKFYLRFFDSSEFELSSHRFYDTFFSSNKTYDVIFMDVKRLNAGGIYTLNKYMAERPDCLLIAVIDKTGSVNIEKFPCAFDFVYMEEIKTDIERLLSAINEKLNIYPKKIYCRDNAITVHQLQSGSKKVDIKNIVYIETAGRNTLIHCTNENIICNNKMRDLISCLKDYGFHQPYRSYIVNFDYIETVTRQDITLTTGDKVYISRDNYRDFKEKYEDWTGKK